MRKEDFVRKTKKVLRNPLLIIWRLAGKGIVKIDDKSYILNQFKEIMGYELNLDNPQTFVEKLNWLKLFDQNPSYINMVDKYEVKDYVRRVIGDNYIIKTYGIYDCFDDIDFSIMPKQFVIKCTHDCGSIIVVEDKTKMNLSEMRRKLMSAQKKNAYYNSREWVYKEIKPRIIIEEYLKDEITDELRDYKFYCFNGYVHSLLLATNRQNKEKDLCFDYFDSEFRHLSLINHWHPNADIVPEKPLKFDEMVKIASNLSRNIPHVRVDLYEANGQVYFGEFTFFDMGGFLKIHPDNWDIEWGGFIDLSLAYGRNNNI